ncbi:unnamed protein product [Adineta steineri]|nr:unnamed protein product [Adineta steineri]CAF3522885.1 unnamed protein product [Adineta steineri]CAF3859315.1 unnamed protein product [Adineta steineri]
MLSCAIRFVIFLAICLAIAHAYPSSSMHRIKMSLARTAKYPAAYDGQNVDYNNHLVDANDNDINDSNGFATWLFRSRKFCCAPPL